VPPELRVLVDPETTAVVTSELQNGVVGESSVLPDLAAAARGAIANTARLCTAARAAGAAVIHCTAATRADRRGSNSNARLFNAVRKSGVELLPGTPATEVVPELGPVEGDLVLSRLHGLDPMAGTDLDPVLRNLGIRTLVVTGVSVNIAITNLVMDSVNRGYQAVLPRDAVTGVPAEYADAVIENTLSLLATITTTDDVIAAWKDRA
jgi:nicotinamidase-related amidase